MDQPSPRAGGCLLMLCILLGFLGGLTQVNPLSGVLIGTIVGIILATGVWLLDRHRQR